MFKVSVFGVFLVHIHFKCGKIRTRKTPNTDTSQAVKIIEKSLELRGIWSLKHSELMKHFVVRNEQNLKISKKEAINKTKLKDDNINNELKDTILIN